MRTTYNLRHFSGHDPYVWSVRPRLGLTWYSFDIFCLKRYDFFTAGTGLLDEQVRNNV
jgi:hypothetical protein